MRSHRLMPPTAASMPNCKSSVSLSSLRDAEVVAMPCLRIKESTFAEQRL